MRIPITPYGRRETRLHSGLALALLVLIAAAWATLRIPELLFAAALPIAQIVLTLLFFRDPERRPTAGAGPEAILAPADGRVADVAEVDEPDFIGGPAVAIGIAVGWLDCRVNRFPASGTVERVVHRAASLTGIRAAGGVPIVVRQVASAASGGIVNPLARGDAARRGERFGMIKLGSRCEVLYPRDRGIAAAVRPGDRVRAGESAIARLAPVSEPVNQSLAAPRSASRPMPASSEVQQLSQVAGPPPPCPRPRSLRDALANRLIHRLSAPVLEEARSSP